MTVFCFANQPNSLALEWNTSLINSVCYQVNQLIVLIQSHLESLPAHTMQYFSLPHSISTQLNRFHRNFLWKNATSNSRVPLIAWDTVCKPKNKGGLGLRRADSVNAAFQCKLAWRLKSGYSWLGNYTKNLWDRYTFKQCWGYPVLGSW